MPPAERIATFDQDGTLWVEHPMYSQVMYILERVPVLVKAKPELAEVAPFSTVLEVLQGDRAAMAKLTLPDFEKVAAATITGMPVETFKAEVKKWLAEAKDPRWKKPYTELTYLPMQEVMTYLRASGYKTYIVTGGGQDFVRLLRTDYGIPPEQVVGTALGTTYGYAKDGKPFLTKEPKLLLNDNNAGKPEGIHLMIGRRPTWRSATRPVTSRCSNTPRPATGRACPCWCCTTMRSANTPTARRRGYRRPRSALSRRRCTMRRRSRGGRSSA